MNAVIALCHFCETHGPCVVFCTQSLRETKIPREVTGYDTTCESCISIGHDVGILSKDKNGGVNYLSTQKPILKDVMVLLKQACVRSLSCDVSPCKDGGIVYFGDTIRGHVLSHTFQIRDSQARGFYRWFSIIILMKDKMFLLNVTSFLSEHLKEISSELQSYATSIYNEDQSKCSQRAHRLTVESSVAGPTRSLKDLTGQTHIFAHLHSHFTWLLSTGGQCLTERIAQGSLHMPPFIGKDTEEGFTLIQMDQQIDLGIPENIGEPPIKAECYTLRELKELLGKDSFAGICYCVLTGIQVIARGPEAKASKLISTLCCLFPGSALCNPRFSNGDYLSPSEARLLVLGSHVAVPQPCSAIFRVDIVENRYIVRWLGLLPDKTPTLFIKILKAVSDIRLAESTLEKHIRALIEEWQNIVMALKRAKNSPLSDIGPLKQILGVQIQDNPLIEYWMDRSNKCTTHVV